MCNMGLKIYIAGVTPNTDVKKKTQRILMVLDSLQVEYEAVDITEPGKQDEKEFLKCNGRACEGRSVPLVPQLFYDDKLIGDYDDFDNANECNTLKQFLKQEVSQPEIELLQETSTSALENGVDDDTVLENGHTPEEETEDAEESDVKGEHEDEEASGSTAEDEEEEESGEDKSDKEKEEHDSVVEDVDEKAGEKSEHEEVEKKYVKEEVVETKDDVEDEEDDEEEEEEEEDEGGEKYEEKEAKDETKTQVKDGEAGEEEEIEDEEEEIEDEEEEIEDEEIEDEDEEIEEEES